MLSTSSASSCGSSMLAGHSSQRSSRSPSPISISSLTTVSRSPSRSCDEDTRSPVRSPFSSLSSSSSSSPSRTSRRSSTSISSRSSSSSRCNNTPQERPRLSRDRNRLTSEARRNRQSMKKGSSLRESLDEGESPTRREYQSLPQEGQAPEQKDFRLRLKAKMKLLLTKASARDSQDQSQKVLSSVIGVKKRLSSRCDNDENVASGSGHEVKHKSQCTWTSKEKIDISHKHVSHLPTEQAAQGKTNSIGLPSSSSSNLTLASSFDAHEETSQAPAPISDAGPSPRRSRVQGSRKRIMQKLRKTKKPESGSLYPFIIRSYRMLEPVEEDVPSSGAISNVKPVRSRRNQSAFSTKKQKETKDPNGKKKKSSDIINFASNESQQKSPVNLRDELSKLETPTMELKSPAKLNSSQVRNVKTAPLKNVSTISTKSVKRNIGLAKSGHKAMTSLMDVPAPRQSRDDFPMNSRDSDRNYEMPCKERKPSLKNNCYGFSKSAPGLSSEEPNLITAENCRQYLKVQNKNKDMFRAPTETEVDLPQNSRSESLNNEDDIPLDYFVTLLTQKIEDLRETLETIKIRMYQESQLEESNSPPRKKRILSISKTNEQEQRRGLNTRTGGSSNQGNSSPIQNLEYLPENSRSKSSIMKHEKTSKEQIPLFKQKTTLPPKAAVTSEEKKESLCAFEERRRIMFYEDTMEMNSSHLEDSTSVQGIENASINIKKLLDKKTKMRSKSDIPIKEQKSKNHKLNVLFKPSESKQGSNLKHSMKDSIMDSIPLGKQISGEVISTNEPLELTPSRKGRNISAQGRSAFSSSSPTPSPESPSIPEARVKPVGKNEVKGRSSFDRLLVRKKSRSRFNQHGGSRLKPSNEDAKGSLPSAPECPWDAENQMTEATEKCEFLDQCPLHGCSSPPANGYRSPRK